jgi:hypothetical protein
VCGYHHLLAAAALEGRARPQGKSFDFILNTVAAPHDLDPFLTLLKGDVKYRFVIDCKSLAA